jgi:LPS-assembly protein
MKKIRPKISIPVILIITLLITQTFSFATASDLLNKKPEKIKWNISALKVTYDDKKGVYIAEQDVRIKGGDTTLTCDYLEFNNISTDAYARGKVVLASGQDSISCDSLQMNLQAETGTIHNGTLFMQENNFHIKGNKIEKIQGDTYKTDKGTITSCSGDVPDWKISARDIEVTIEGYGFAKHATLWAKKVPALYVPYLIFPAKRERQTGLIAPRFSSSSRKGIEYEQPLFLAISKNQDATLYLDFMEERGVKTGLEYRYIIDNDSKGAFFVDYLHDRKTDDGTSKTSDYSYATTPQRTNKNRYWVRSKLNQKLPFESSLKLDLDVVSDADYLHEFKNGLTGFEETGNYFEDTFGRSIDDYDDTTRENRFNLNKIWSNKALNIDFNWFDNVEARQEDTDDNTLQTLPSIAYTSSKQKISSSPFYYNINSSFDSFYRKDTTTSLINGERLDFNPTFSLPFKIKQYLYIEPSIGLRETAWYAKGFQDTLSRENRFTHREIYDLNLDLSTQFIKIFNTDSGFADKIKHEIIPELQYTYIPDIDQTDLPYFNSTDRISEENSITYLLTQRFTKRKTSQNNTSIYDEFAWIKIYQSYYINKARDDEDETFSDISFEAEFSFNEYLSLNSKFDWSHYDHDFTSNETSIKLSDLRGDFIKAEYRYEEGVSESAFGTIKVIITDNMSVYYFHEHDLFNEERIESRIGFELVRSCWSLLTTYSDSPDDKSVSVFITLHGIGAFGTK